MVKLAIGEEGFYVYNIIKQFVDLEIKDNKHSAERIKVRKSSIISSREFTFNFDKKQSAMDFFLSVYLDLERQQFTKRETNAYFSRQ